MDARVNPTAVESRTRREVWQRIRLLGLIPQSLTALILIVLVAIPLTPMMLQSVLDKPLYYPDAQFTLSNYSRFVTDAEIRDTLGATALFTMITVTFSMVVGTGLALLVGRTDLPFRGTLLNLLLWPLFLSPQVIGFGAILAYGPAGLVTQMFVEPGQPAPWQLYSVVGIALIAALAATPMTILYCLTAARQQDPNHLAAARVTGAGHWRTLTRISLPLMRPALIFAFIMNIIHALETLAIPLILGSPVGINFLATLIYDKSFAQGTPDYGLVSVLAVFLLLIVALLFWVQRVVLRKSYRFVSVGSRAARPQPMELGKWRIPVLIGVLAYVLLGTLVLIGAVGLRSFTAILSPFVSPWDVLTLSNYRNLLSVDVYVRSIQNTLVLAVLGAAAGTALITAVSLVAQRSESVMRRIVDITAQIPRVVPGVIVGLGVFYALVFIPGMRTLSGTIWPLFIAYMIRFLSSGYGIVSPALVQISGDFDRAAKSVGAGWSTTMNRIIIPLTKPAILSCFVLLMILIVKEYASALFLMKPGSEVIGSTMLSLWMQGQTGEVAALSMLQVAMTTILILIATRVLGVKLNG